VEAALMLAVATGLKSALESALESELRVSVA